MTYINPKTDFAIKKIFCCKKSIELVFVELLKFTKPLKALTDKWIYFLKAANQLKTVQPSLDEVPAIPHAFQVA